MRIPLPVLFLAGRRRRAVLGASVTSPSRQAAGDPRPRGAVAADRGLAGVLANVPLILTSVSLNALAQILLKQGMMDVGRFELGAGQLAAIAPKVAFSPFVIGGVACYGLSIGLWLMVLSRVDVSAAYPFLSVGFAISAVAGYWLFGEHLGLSRSLGIALICGGVFMISRS